MADQPAVATGTPAHDLQLSRQKAAGRARWGRVAVYGVLILLVIIYLTPVYLTVVTSLKDPAHIRLPTAWEPPRPISWEGYATAWRDFAPKLRNSFILAVTATALSAIMGSMNGYVLAKWRLPGERYIFPLIVFGMFIPYQSILIPLFQFLRSVNLYGGLPGLILVHVVYGLPITTLLFRNFYAELPDEMVQAASIDGAGFFGIYRWVILPLSAPAFTVVIIWQFTQIWNEFLFAVTLTQPAAQPITVALANLAGGEAVRWNMPMAGSVLAALPTVLVYILLGRYFIRGMLAGSLKG
ncbi:MULTISPECIES: carbohydrate ABC transporter permease [Limnochorda]|uniref:carbohydrate ABC transporter permease n=1 Tax=Limnochorda TaxID=1676651 RepID=UPI00182810DA|nr:carbohydrate ABC transporter permease [Limnochorda pilosa]MBO2486606.1 ABC transporter permease [Bacillota bacterium]MBO2518499.1 ABC transporter permease [Bacillota bacterium]NMA72145.1 carbohydrate ABC transporter permease [Bacillota bacterium]